MKTLQPSNGNMCNMPNMRAIFLGSLLCLSLIACSSKQQVASTTMPVESKIVDDSANKTMAYEHALRLELEEVKIAPLYESVHQFCRRLPDNDCIILQANLSTGRYVSANLKLRASSQGIQKLIANLRKQAEVVEQSVSAEDLAAPMQDTQRKLSMLGDYRARLEELRKRPGADIDALIKANKELAEVQGQIESLTGTQAHLLQRVNTEILSVSISADQSRSFIKPVKLALAGFADNLSQGAASAITGLAYLLPWSLILFACAWLTRKLWRRKKAPATKD